MKLEDYKILNTYALYDGIYLGVIWTGAFVCFLGAAYFSFLAQFNTMLILCTPFFVAYRMRLMRDKSLEGLISFKQGMLYCFRVYFTGALILGIIQYLYFKFLDNGRMLQSMIAVIQSKEGGEIIKSYGYKIEEAISILPQVFTSQNIVFGSFIYEMILGFFLSIITCLILKRSIPKNKV